MDTLLQFEASIIIFLQSLGDWLSAPMEFFSFLGTERAYLVIMPFLFWCVDAGLGLKIGLIMLLSNGLNAYLKVAFRSPRPYWVFDQVKALSAETSFGLPSGHAQNAASIWGLLAGLVRRRWGAGWVVPASALLIFLIGLSRLYLGVHFIRDVVTGWLAGLILLWLFLRWMDPLGRWLSRQSLGTLLGLSAVSTVVMLGIMLVIFNLQPGWVLPPEWVSAAAAAAPEDPIDPLSREGMYTLAGTWFGMTAGYAVFYRRYGRMETGGTPQALFLRYLIGMVGLLVIYAGLGAIFPAEPATLGFSLRFLRYTLIGLWVALFAPLIFRQAGLLRVLGQPAVQ